MTRPEPPPHVTTRRIDLDFSWGRAKRTVDTLLTAFVLAFVFRAFMVEAFIIPTGSMAHALNGAHGTRVCGNCGWEFDFGPSRGTADVGAPFVWPRTVLCPNCQERTDTPEQSGPPPKPGDRVLVHKWPFQLGGLFAPRRWDVIVFRDPSNPNVNYIKRLVGLPGETVEIIHGDLFIRRRGEAEVTIARKTHAAQASLWFVVYDSNYLPERAARYGVLARWIPDGGAASVGAWKGLDTRRMLCRPTGEKPQVIRFAPQGPHAYLKDMYAYDRGTSGQTVGDVRLVGEVTPRGGDGWVEFRIQHGDMVFAGRLARDGTATLTMSPRDDTRPPHLVATGRCDPLRDGRPIAIELAHVDYRVYLRVDGREIVSTTDDTYSPDLSVLRSKSNDLPPVELSIASQRLALDLHGLRIDRDVYYTYRAGVVRRAWAGHGFSLDTDEYFVLGDNSPESFDSREWYRGGIHLPAGYRAGTVRADKIVGRAFFVYLPGLMPFDRRGRLHVIDVGRMRFVR